MKNYIKSVCILLILIVGKGALAQTATAPPAGGPCPDINVSTGIDQAGAPLAVGAVDPNWTIASGPAGPIAKRVPTALGFWEPTPVSGTNACWINPSGSLGGSPPGIYVFERSFNVVPGTTSFTANFGVTCDDILMSVELVPPSGPSIPLSVPPAPTYMLSAPIGYVVSAPVAGTWKIRVTVNFVDSEGGMLLSGTVDVDCGDSPCNCENMFPQFTWVTNENCVTTFTGTINTACLGTNITWTWTVNGSPAGTGPTWSYAFPGNGVYTVCLAVTMTDADGNKCTREICHEVVIDCEPCTCDMLKPDFIYTIDHCIGYFTGTATGPCCMTKFSYEWYVNGSPVGTGTNFTYTFPGNGLYNVCVFVTTQLPDGTLCHKEICKLIEVRNCDPCNCDQLEIGFNYQLEECVGHFQGWAKGPACMKDFTYEWSVNGSPAGTGPTFDYNFPSNGFYNICLFVTVTLPDGTVCHKEYCQLIQVTDCGDPCNCDMLQIDFDFWLEHCVGHFTAYATGPECMQNYTYQWYVNGSPVGFGQTFDYTFAANGTYNVCLFVTVTLPDGTLCHKEICHKVEVKDCDPCNCDQLQIGFDYTIEHCDGHFYGWAQGPDCMQDYVYEWYVNGSPAGSGSVLNYTFSSNGTYTICLYVTVTLSDGTLCHKEFCRDVKVTDCDPCTCDMIQVNFDYTVQGCTGYFYGNAQVPPCALSFSYQWTVDGNPVASTQNMTYMFGSNGTYYVCVVLTVVMPDGTICKKEACRYIEVTDCNPCNCDELIVSYNYSIQQCLGHFQAVVTAPHCMSNLSYQWLINGSPAGTGATLNYTFGGNAIYNVCLIVTATMPDGSICEKQFCKKVKVTDCQPCNCELLTGTIQIQQDACFMHLVAIPNAPSCMTVVSYTWTANGSYIGSGQVLNWNAPGNGTYNICVLISALLPNGQKCEKKICKDVVVVNCHGTGTGGGTPIGMAPYSGSVTEETVKLYPNPTDSDINVDFTTEQSGTVSVSLKTMDGKEISHETRSTEAGDQHFLLKVPASVSDEMIFVEITTADAKIVRKVSVSKR